MLDEGNLTRSFYLATRKLASLATVPNGAGVRDLFPDKDSKEY